MCDVSYLIGEGLIYPESTKSIFPVQTLINPE